MSLENSFFVESEISLLTLFVKIFWKLRGVRNLTVNPVHEDFLEITSRNVSYFFLTLVMVETSTCSSPPPPPPHFSLSLLFLLFLLSSSLSPLPYPLSILFFFSPSPLILPHFLFLFLFLLFSLHHLQFVPRSFLFAFQSSCYLCNFFISFFIIRPVCAHFFSLCC